MAWLQLELELDDKRVAIPWDGVSPRMLTKSYKLFSVDAHGASRLIRDAPLQWTLFLQGSPYDEGSQDREGDPGTCVRVEG